MSDTEILAERFEAERSRLRSLAYRMLGSSTEADDAVQEAFLRAVRADRSDIDNLAGWLTTNCRVASVTTPVRPTPSGLYVTK